MPARYLSQSTRSAALRKPPRRPCCSARRGTRARRRPLLHQRRPPTPRGRWSCAAAQAKRRRRTRCRWGNPAAGKGRQTGNGVASSRLGTPAGKTRHGGPPRLYLTAALASQSPTRAAWTSAWAAPRTGPLCAGRYAPGPCWARQNSSASAWPMACWACRTSLVVPEQAELALKLLPGLPGLPWLPGLPCWRLFAAAAADDDGRHCQYQSFT